MKALVRLKRWRQEGRCLRNRHAWTKVHDAIWHGAYVICSHCGKRDVIGGDQYGPHAPMWRAYGSPPPGVLPALLWGRREWDAWHVQCRVAATESGGSTACTCPSGDGSLRWPCPQHPPTTESGGSDR